ncbi:MAG: WG repeat-containing protein [Flammeovirgaceae bacterium]|nr:WG repeat-containing protein [Flammeovirgaceae bacterium]
MINCFLTGVVFCLSLQSVADPFVRFEENGKVGIKNQQGAIVVSASYESLGWSDGRFSVVNNVTGYKKNGRWGILSLQEKKITNPIYESLNVAEGGLLYASKISSLSQRIQTGCINTSGEVVIPFIYDCLTVQSLRAIVCVRDQKKYSYGIIDLKNQNILPIQYKSIYPIGSLRYAVENFESKTAIFSDAGTPLTDFFIDSIANFQFDLAVIYKEGKQGVINRDGKIMKDPVCAAIKLSGKDRIETRAFNQWGIRESRNSLVKEFEADDLTIHKDRFIVRKGNLEQVCDSDLNVLSNWYDSIKILGDDFFVIHKKGQYGLLQRNGKEVIPPVYSSISISANRIIVSKNIGKKARVQLFDVNGQSKSIKTYDQIEPYAEYFKVRVNTFWGLIDADGNEVLYGVYDSIQEIHHQHAVIKFQGLYGIANLYQQWILSPQNLPIQLINDTLFIAQQNNIQFLKDIDGTIVYFTSNFIEVEKDHILEHASSGKWKIDFRGRIISRELTPEIPVEKIYPSTEGLRAIQRNGRYGFVDDQGRLRIANRYENVRPFENGIAPAKIRGKWGFINHEDKIVIQPTYDEVKMLGTFILVTKSKKFGLVDHRGNLIVSIRYDEISPLPSGRFLIKNENLFGLLDQKGDRLLHTKYESVEDQNNGYVIVSQNQKFGLLTTEGITTIPIQFDKLVYDPNKNFYYTMKRSEWSN